MTDPNDIEIDDIVTKDDLDDRFEEFRDEFGDPSFDPDEFDVPDHGEIQDVADRTFFERLQHLVNEDCDTEACNRLRDRFGIDPTEGGDESEGNEESSRGESESSDDSSDGEDPEEAESADESPESDTGETEEWDESTNIFGEPV